MEVRTETPGNQLAAAATAGGLDPDASSETGEAAGDTLQFVTFTVGEEVYAVDIMQVREIKGWSAVTPLPNQPAFMRGVLNLRGVIVPIYDLRCRFGHGKTEATSIHVVVIVAVSERIVGILVDTVSDILTVGSDQIRAVPKIEERDDGNFLKGLVTTGERMVAILSLDRLIGRADEEPRVTADAS